MENLLNNAVSQKIISSTKKFTQIFFKSPSEIQESTKAVSKQVVSPLVAQSLFEQGGKYSSVFLRIAGFSGATAVILGAYGSHRTWEKDPNSNRDPRAIFETANRYHFFHTIALLATPLAKRPYLTGTLITSGTLLFCGVCYYSALTNDQRYNRLAPLGGTMLILAWASFMFF